MARNANSPFGKDNLDAARQYIAESQAQHPEIKGRKSPGEMAPNQVIRQANSYYRQQQEGLAPSLRAARGHGNTPERPGAKHAPVAPAYERAKARNQVRVSMSKYKNGNYELTGLSNANALATLGVLLQRGDSVQVIKVNTTLGYRSLPFSTNELYTRLADGENMGDIIAEAMAEHEYESDDDDGGYDDYDYDDELDIAVMVQAA